MRCRFLFLCLLGLTLGVVGLPAWGADFVTGVPVDLDRARTFESAGEELPPEKRPPEGSGRTQANPHISPVSMRPPPGLVARAQRAHMKPRVSAGWTVPAGSGDRVRLAFTLEVGPEEDRLLGVTSGWAGFVHVVLASTDLDGTNPIVRAVGRLRFAPGSRVVFHADATSGFGIVLGTLRRDLRAGQIFPVILHFEKAGPIPVPVQVRAK